MGHRPEYPYETHTDFFEAVLPSLPTSMLSYAAALLSPFSLSAARMPGRTTRLMSVHSRLRLTSTYRA